MTTPASVDPTIEFVGPFDPSVIPFGGADHPYPGLAEGSSSTIGCKIDFGSNYFGVATGLDSWPWAIAGSGPTVPGFIQLWRITGAGAVYINQFRFEVPCPLGWDAQPRTCLDSHVKVGQTKAVCAGYSGGGGSAFLVVVERVGETLVFGPVFHLFEQEMGGFFDTNNPVGWPSGSMLLVGDGSDSFVVVVAVGGIAQGSSWNGYGLVTRRCNVLGRAVTPATEWLFSVATTSFFASGEYSWLYGLSVIGGQGYVLAWDWQASWSLHRISLLTGEIVQSVQVARPALSEPETYSGIMTMTEAGLTTVIFQSDTVSQLHVRSYRPSDLALVGEYVVPDPTGRAFGIWQDWFSNELPVTDFGGYVPWVFMNSTYDPSRPTVGLFDGTHVATTEFAGRSVAVEFSVREVFDWETGIAVVGDGRYLIGSGSHRLPGWGADPAGNQYTPHVFPCGLFRVPPMSMTAAFRGKTTFFAG